MNVDKVKVILGGICSGETLAAAPITEAAKVILLSPSATSPDITNAGDYVFRTIPSDANAGRISAQTAIKNGLKLSIVQTITLVPNIAPNTIPNEDKKEEIKS